MANHKRKGPKSTRAGCLMCKPHKDQRRKDTGDALTRAERRANDIMASQIDERPCPTCQGNPDWVCECGFSECNAGCVDCGGTGVD